jgi:hypothetical protein
MQSTICDLYDVAGSAHDAQAYHLKSIAAAETGSHARIYANRAAAARHFVARMAEVLATGRSNPSANVFTSVGCRRIRRQICE